MPVRSTKAQMVRLAPPVEPETHTSARGSVVIEFMLILPALAVSVMLLLGITEALLNRPHALIAARYAASYERIAGTSPPSASVAAAASTPEKNWQLQLTRRGALNQVLSEIGDLPQPVRDVLSGLLHQSEARGSVAVDATLLLQGKRIAGLIPLRSATARYETPGDTWTGGKCGLFFTMVRDKLAVAMVFK